MSLLDEKLNKHIDTISYSRIEPYMSLCRKICEDKSVYYHQKMAICVYTSLQHRLGVFIPLIQDIEVAVRNEMSRVLREYLAEDKDLYKLFHQLQHSEKFSAESRRLLTQCIEKLRKTNRKYDENDIISNLTFGFTYCRRIKIPIGTMYSTNAYLITDFDLLKISV